MIKKHKSIKCSLYTHAVYCRELFRRILSTSCQQPLLVFEISSAITLSVVPNTSCKSINIRKHTEAANRVEVMAGILQLGQVTIILYNFYLYPFQLYCIQLSIHDYRYYKWIKTKINTLIQKIAMPQPAYGALSVTALIGLVTLTFDLLTSK